MPRIEEEDWCVVWYGMVWYGELNRDGGEGC